MFVRSGTGRLLVGAALAAGVLTAAPAYASSASTQDTTHESFDATGAAFTCGTSVLTVTGGTADQVMHSGLDGAGVFHYTGTLTVHDLTARDASGAEYTITGTSWFGGKGTEAEQQVETDTSHFVVHDAQGGVYGQVRIVDHFSVNGSSFVLDLGGCEPPPDQEG